MELKTPQSLKKEHDELHAKLARAKEVGGATGTAAKSVAEVLHPHFLKEEEYALPQLGLLPVLAEISSRGPWPHCSGLVLYTTYGSMALYLKLMKMP